jgi:phosphoribosyl-dephospho-CoA transferase
MRTQTHCLLRIRGAEVLHAPVPLPAWVGPQLRQAPWVVVRRAPECAGRLAVGVRGGSRAQRVAAWLERDAALECLAPWQIAARRAWQHCPRAPLPALAALDRVESIMMRQSLADCWGPGGSVAFELASGYPSVTDNSDLDLIVQPSRPLPPAAAAALARELAQLPVRVDVRLEAPRGGVALGEYALGRPPYLVRTAEGPRLLADPWAQAAAA